MHGSIIELARILIEHEIERQRHGSSVRMSPGAADDTQSPATESNTTAEVARPGNASAERRGGAKAGRL